MANIDDYQPIQERTQKSGPTRSPAPSPGSSSSSNPFLDTGSDTESEDRPSSFEGKLEGEFDAFNWIDVVASEVTKSLSAWGKANGYSSAIMGNIYNQHARTMFVEMEQAFSMFDEAASDRAMARMAGVPLTPGEFGSTPEGMQQMVDWALNWFGGKAGIPLKRASSGGGGGRGGGSRGPTAEDIRNQFDIKELSNNVNEMNRAMVFEDHVDPTGVAREYVDAIVATKGEKKIDFATFVEEKIKKTSRFQVIYRNKPEHLSPGEYMAPYIGAARSVAAPEEADDIAIGAAQFGASPEAFRQRLQREDTVTGSAPFIQGMEARLSELSSIFKG